eukprot:gb/GECH01004293.1/.p1 GENE.gb/GECH01004293.1/~~gb/GECH01004293.1/.p1  ORF type:complete len:483 (+),score=57.38 gb/GECH01004293.1/:1-1449(+)
MTSTHNNNNNYNYNYTYNSTYNPRSNVLLLTVLVLLVSLAVLPASSWSYTHDEDGAPSVSTVHRGTIHHPGQTGGTASQTSGHFLWISDVHYDPIFTGAPKDDDFCRGTPKKGVPFGRYGCDAPYPLVSSAAQEVYQVTPDPDFIIFSGDFAAHHLPREDLCLKAIRNVTNTFHHYYPRTLVFPCIGNNDVYPDYHLPLDDKGTQYLKTLYDAWSPFLPESTKSTFIKGGYYSVNMTDGLRIVVLNSIYYSVDHSPDTSSVDDPKDQFSWLTDELISAYHSKQKVYIITHIPPSDNYFDDIYLWKQKYANRYFRIVDKFSSIIQSQFYGHLHADDFRLIFSSTTASNSPVGFGLITPAISPVFETNPGFRTFQYDTNSYELVDYKAFYFDLFKSTRQKKSNWLFEYSFSDVYKQRSVSVGPLLSIFDKLKTDASLFALWQSFRVSLFVPMRWHYLCAIRYVRGSQKYHDCLNENPDLETLPY